MSPEIKPSTVSLAPVHLRLPDRANNQELVARHADTVGGFAAPPQHGLTILTRFLPAADQATFMAAAQQAAIAAANAGLTVTDFDYDLVTIADIARRINCPRNTIGHYVRGLRGPGRFPRRFGRAGRSDVWDWGTVNAWLRAFNGAGDPGYLPPRNVLEYLNSWLTQHHTSGAPAPVVNQLPG